MTNEVVPFVQMGLGPLGQRMTQYALQRDSLKLVAAVDPDPNKVGQDVGTLAGCDAIGVLVQPSLVDALKALGDQPQPRVAVLSTVSSVERLLPQVIEASAAGLHVVSTCEELSYPWNANADIAKQVDEACTANNTACIGTGINPGFLMDYLPAVFTGICQDVSHVRVSRMQDASHRRVPFQQKIGAGLTVEQFKEKQEAGTLRHVGLTESIDMIAAALGWKLDNRTDTLKPVIAEQQIITGYKPIEPGMACGVEQIGRGFVGDKIVIELIFRATVGESAPHDTIEIQGTPPLTTTVPGGVNGDVATCAITLNAIHSILRAQPGLNTMLDMPIPTRR